jgi:Rrf2 family transcriptional regulator, iron-sulfur cluster assembly transcription factor
MFARSSGYAVQALTHLAGQPSGKLVGAREMATTLHIPMPFLWKILRKLGQKKLVRSFKGVHGGYELARPAETIHVSEILTAGRDIDQVGGCILGLEQCSDQDPCPLHAHWKDLRTQIEATLETTTLADLAKNANHGRRKRAYRRRASAKLSVVS